jgi:Na+/H+-dicarboxylate symporter
MKPVSSKKLAVSVVAMLLLGVATGAVWQWQANPAEWEVRADGSIVLTEIAARDQFGVIVVFVIVGAIVSLIWGFATTFALRDLGWRLTPIVILTTLVAAVIAWQVGVALGPEGPQAAVDPNVGDLLPSKLKIDSIPPFLAWPLFGMLGVVLSTWMSKEAPDHVGAHQL